MPTLAAVSADLLGRPRPVLCLDTCELLTVVQCLPQRRAVHVEALNRILTFLASNPDRLQVVITDLVPHEWGQNIADVQQKAGQFLGEIDQDSMLVHDIWSHLGRPLGSAPSTHAATRLVNELTALAQAVMAQASVVDSDSVCVQRALDRVLAKRRPSHAGHIKTRSTWSTTWSCPASSTERATPRGACSSAATAPTSGMVPCRAFTRCLHKILPASAWSSSEISTPLLGACGFSLLQGKPARACILLESSGFTGCVPLRPKSLSVSMKPRPKR